MFSNLFSNFVNILEMFSEVLDADVANATLVGLEGGKVFRLFASTHLANPFDVSPPSYSVNILQDEIVH
jgi:hypothetical protein